MPHTPRTFGDYVVLGEMGRGASGVVYQAVQTRLNRPVALKILRVGLSDDESARQRFMREAEAAASLHHPHIVPVFEAGAVNGELFLSMKSFVGGSLAERLAESGYEPREAAQVVLDLAAATQFAHARGVLHRDIKPGNVLLDEQGKAFLGDFGIAKVLAGSESGTAPAAVVGTPAYLAPEVITEGARAATVASDVYGLGAVLYEMLAGRPPYPGKDPLAILQRVLSEEILPPRETRRRHDGRPRRPVGEAPIPRDLEVICLKCLERSPGRRYASAMDLEDDLGRFLRGEPVRARPVPAPERVWRWCRRRPARAALLGLTALSLLAGGSALFWQWRQARWHEASMRVAYQAQQRQHIEQLLARDDIASGLSQLARALQEDPSDAGKRRRILSVLAAHTFPLPLAPPLRHGEPVRRAAFLPGDREVFTVSGAQVRFWEAASGRPTRVLATPARLRTAFADPGGGSLLTLAESGDVTVWSLEDLRARFSARLQGEEPLCAAAWHGTGGTLFLLGRSGQLRWFDGAGRELGGGGSWPGTWVAAASQPGGGLVAALEDSGRIRFWSVRDGRESGPPLVPRETASDLLFSPSGVWILTLGKTRGSANAFHVQTRRRLDPQPLHVRQTSVAAFSPEGLRLAGVVDEVQAAVWELLPRRRGTEWLRHEKRILSLAFSGDGSRLISGSEDGTAVLWSALAGEAQPFLLPAGGPPERLGFSPQGSRLEVITVDGRRWGWETGRATWDTSASPPGTTPMPGLPTGAGGSDPTGATRSVSPDGAWQATASPEGEVRVLATGPPFSGERVLALRGSVRRLAFDSRGSMLLVGRASGGVGFYETTTLLPAAEPVRANPDLLDLAVAPGDGWLATSHEDGAVRAWRLWSPLDSTAGASPALIRLAAAVGGQDHRPDGTLRHVTAAELHQVCDELRGIAGRGSESEFIRWFLADRQRRPAAPGAEATALENLEAALRAGFSNLPVRAASLLPRHPAVLRRAAAYAERGRRLPALEAAWLRQQADALERPVFRPGEAAP